MNKPNKQRVEAYAKEISRAVERAARGDHEYAAAFYRWASSLAEQLACSRDLPPTDRLDWADRSNAAALEWLRHLEAHRGA